jgi:hypothetical protein
MITITSMITIVGIGIYSQPETLHIYAPHVPAEHISVVDELPSVVAWKKMSSVLGIKAPPHYETAKARNETKAPNTDISKAFDMIALPQEHGHELLNKAKEFLSEAKFPCTSVAPILAHDPEEGASFLTLRLYVNASMEEAFKLDSSLTKDLIATFPKLPVTLSFSVYENEGEVV